MRAEDLFIAIGQVESERLARTEMQIWDPSEVIMEGQSMKKRNTKRYLRNMLVAAAIISLLAVTACAVGALLLFDSPQDMITTIFGDKTGYDHSEGSVETFPDGIGTMVEPTYDRVPADEEVVAQEAAPLVEAVGQSLSWAGYTLTIDANLYDAATQCGLVTYILENPAGVEYEEHGGGEISDVVSFNQYGKKYIIQDKTTDTCLAATYYYQLRDPKNRDLEITFSQWTAIDFDDYLQTFRDTKEQLKKEITEEEVIAHVKEQMGEDYAQYEAESTREAIISAGYDGLAYERMGVLDGAYDPLICQDKIIIEEHVMGEMTNMTLGNGAVTLSPIAVTIRVEDIAGFPNNFLDLVKIGFADGTEYVVKEDWVLNHVFAVSDSETEETTFLFNRIIDVDQVVSVTVDGEIVLTKD